ncbi:peptidoglycan-binding protein [Ruegeria sp. ANG-S4]|uniref:holin-associated N-acetylmuramidase n=1 Tax=Ruegeria sp. ANG-S4 TaxID=1577904 RepID=UPI00057F4D97|nr:holin-associated N-acetylmuramidase [Ruegeria sp. ANG-S4]KIC44325.1 peptidoglycan-binding protein [Ruegeria sp. ANG-S4]
MQSVREIANAIVDREGGFVDDPDDPGGATKHGVTIHTLRRLGLDLTGDGAVDRADVRALTKRRAVEIFVTHYFDRPRIDLVPGSLQPSLFDMYVNAGAQAVKTLQRLLCEMGFDVSIDGAIGPQTASASHKAAGSDGELLRDAYGVARRNYYFRLADSRPSLRKYARTRAGSKGGWIKRAEEFLSPRYHLSQSEFEKRVSAWD